MGWLFPILVWDTPSSSMWGKWPAHLENSKMRLVKRLNIIMNFLLSFFFVFFSYIFWVFLAFSYLEINLNYT